MSALPDAAPAAPGLAGHQSVLTSLNPATGAVLGAVHQATPAQAQAAITIARTAARGWAATAPAERAGYLRAAAARLGADAARLTELQSAESGKPAEDSAGGVAAGIAAVTQYAELGPLHRGTSLQGGAGALDLMVYEPRGVVVLLTPWNDPVAIVCQLLAAALAVGNTVVFKPSERTPLTGQAVADAFELPDGVLTVQHGNGQLGRLLVADPRVDVVVHVGGSATGREIAQVTAGTSAKAVLELGGKDACLVDAGVDPQWAAAQVALGAFANAGQICTSVERVYVHADIAEPFLAALTEEATNFRIGPLIDTEHREGVHAQVQAAIADGARLLAGGRLPAGPGAFYPPTVLADVRDSMPVMTTETFGPVAAVATVESFEDGLERAATSAYGLAATVLSRDLDHIQTAIDRLPVGTVKVNAVFGGAPGGAAEPRRGSGQGFGYGPELLDELTQVKVIHLQPAPPSEDAAGSQWAASSQLRPAPTDTSRGTDIA